MFGNYPTVPNYNDRLDIFNRLTGYFCENLIDSESYRGISRHNHGLRIERIGY
jgi:hypothetical protein